MNMRSWKFFGGPNQLKGEAHEILDVFFDKVYSFFNNSLVPEIEKYSNIKELVKDKSMHTDNKHTYFWSWMNKYGLELIDDVLFADPLNSDDFLDLLDHRVYVLNADINSEIKDNVFTSIADSLKRIKDYILSMEEIITTYLEPKISGTFRTNLPNVQAEVKFSHSGINNYFVSETLNDELWKNSSIPAENQQVFCYYLVKE